MLCVKLSTTCSVSMCIYNNTSFLIIIFVVFDLGSQHWWDQQWPGLVAWLTPLPCVHTVYDTSPVPATEQVAYLSDEYIQYHKHSYVLTSSK